LGGGVPIEKRNIKRKTPTRRIPFLNLGLGEVLELFWWCVVEGGGRKNESTPHTLPTL
jgi:hypothetical protein